VDAYREEDQRAQEKGLSEHKAQIDLVHDGERVMSVSEGLLRCLKKAKKKREKKKYAKRRLRE